MHYALETAIEREGYVSIANHAMKDIGLRCSFIDFFMVHPCPLFLPFSIWL